MSEDTFAKSRVMDMIHEYGDVEEVFENFDDSGFDLVLLTNGTVIHIPSGHGRLSYERVWLIADGALAMGAWQIEEWLGQQ